VARKVFESENCTVDLRYCTEVFPGKFFEDLMLYLIKILRGSEVEAACLFWLHQNV